MKQWILTLLWLGVFVILVIALPEWAIGLLALAGLGFLVYYASQPNR